MSNYQTNLSVPKSIPGVFDQEKRKTRPDFARGLLDYREALRMCLESVKSPVETCEISLEESLSRVLRKDMESVVYVPPFNRTMMDGYAVRSADIKSACAGKPVRLVLTGEIPAGFSSDRTVKSGETMRIMTGAAVPQGADAVVKLEGTSCWDGRTVLFFDTVGENPYIIYKGQDLAPGMVTARTGQTVTPAMVGIFAASGVSSVTVSRNITLGIISTGSELVRAGSVPADGQIYDINGYSLFALAKAAGASPVSLGAVKDKSMDLLTLLDFGNGMDILLLSGGVSVGDYDIVHETLQRAGVEEIFWRVKVKPGKPLFFGKKGNTLIFGLPGNPVSSVVNFNLFVRPVLDKLAGKTTWGLRTGHAKILNNRILKSGRRTFLRGKIRESNASLGVEIIAEQRSGVFSPMMNADVLLEIPEDMKILKEGDVVRVYYL
ncbi:MAG: gephyrin-like molybdotransferase Glp [Desulfobacteraceae bacterium]